MYMFAYNIQNEEKHVQAESFVYIKYEEMLSKKIFVAYIKNEGKKHVHAEKKIL